MSPGLEIRDPIHGFIFRDPHEQEIIDTRVFQRLRRLRQLALATLVYPGAVHTRFDHSIGAFWIAKKASRRLLHTDSERRLVTLAALLHDIGHGPFSHVSEDVFEAVCDTSKLNLKPKQQIHEAITAKLILHNPELEYLLSEREREQIIGLLEGSYGVTILKNLVSGPIDVDKQDYLLRDSYFCGVKYGVYDLERLTNTLRVHDDGYDRSLALSEDGVHALEQFVLAKYYMSTQVYRHKIRLITDEMIVRAILLGIREDKVSWLRDLYSYDGTDQYIEYYLSWYDERLTGELLGQNTPDGYAKKIFRQLHERDLYKRIYQGRPSDFGAAARKLLFMGDKDLFNNIEEKVASVFGFDKNEVLIKKVTHKSVRTQATSSEGNIIVLRPGERREFHEESALFKSIDEAIKEEFVEVYAPVHFRDEKDKKKRKADYQRDIGEIIEKLANPQKALPLEVSAGS